MKLISLSPSRLLPWPGITITPSLKSIIGLGRNGIFIYEWPYEGVAFCDAGIVIRENPAFQRENLGPGLPVVERKEAS